MEFEREYAASENGFSLENLSEADRLFLRDMIESLINEELIKFGLTGDF